MADLLIVAVLLVSAISAFVKGFLLEVFSLAGLVLGLFLAAANFAIAAAWLEQWIHQPEAAKLIAFITIALLVMVLAGLLGRLFRGLVRTVGLGIFDRLLGAAFGLVRGCIVVTLVLMGIVAFLPPQHWLVNSRLAPAFLNAVHGGSRALPFALGQQIRLGLEALKLAQPKLVKNGIGGQLNAFSGPGLLPSILVGTHTTKIRRMSG